MVLLFLVRHSTLPCIITHSGLSFSRKRALKLGWKGCFLGFCLIIVVSMTERLKRDWTISIVEEGLRFISSKSSEAGSGVDMLLYYYHSLRSLGWKIGGRNSTARIMNERCYLYNFRCCCILLRLSHLCASTRRVHCFVMRGTCSQTPPSRDSRIRPFRTSGRRLSPALSGYHHLI